MKTKTVFYTENIDAELLVNLDLGIFDLRLYEASL